MNIDHWISAVLALRKATRVVVFTGAGISAESGIPTFRDTDGFWQRFPPEQYANWSGLLTKLVTNPRSVAEFVSQVVEPIAAAEPNPGHHAIAQLHQHVTTTVITQNIDGLHQWSGSTDVLEIHGSLLEVVDRATGNLVHRFQREELIRLAETLRSYVARRMSAVRFVWRLRRDYPFDWLRRHRPNVVMFGDRLAEPAWTRAREAVRQCDLLLAVGTSGAVYPAAMLVDQVEMAGTPLITIDPQVDRGIWLQGSAATVLPKLVTQAFPESVSKLDSK